MFLADMMSTDDESDKKEETKDEIDPLDAFMMGLNGGAQQDVSCRYNFKFFVVVNVNAQLKCVNIMLNDKD